MEPINLGQLDPLGAKYASRAPTDERLAAARGIIGGPQVAAQQQLAQGIQQQRVGMSAAANRRGFAPGLARAAGYAGAALGSRGYGMAAQLAALDESDRLRQQMLAEQAAAKIQGHLLYLDRRAEQERLQQLAFEEQKRQMEAAADDAESGDIASTLSSVGSTIVSALPALLSDERAKLGVIAARARDEDALVRALGRTIGRARDGVSDRAARSIEGIEFAYRDPGQIGGRPGPQYGVRAQDLERTELGRRLVSDSPHGKMIDSGAATGAALGLIGRIGARLDKLEARN